MAWALFAIAAFILLIALVDATGSPANRATLLRQALLLGAALLMSAIAAGLHAAARGWLR